MIPLVLYCPNDITLLAHKIHACIRWEHNLNSIHLLEVVEVLEKGLEQHTKKKSEGFPVGFCEPGNFPETGTMKNLWFGVVGAVCGTVRMSRGCRCCSILSSAMLP